MSTKSTIENQIETALSSLDNIAPAEVPNFFTGKVMSRLKSENRGSLLDTWVSWLLRPQVAFAALCLIILLNVFAVVYNLDNSKGPDQTNIAISEAYTQNTSTSFYLENVKP